MHLLSSLFACQTKSLKKACLFKPTLWSLSICLFTFIFGYRAAISFGAPNAGIVTTHKNNFLADVLKTTNKSATSFIDTTRVSNEIWGRVRNRLHLNSSKSSILMKQHVRTYAKSQDYINKLVRNASPYLFYILEEVERRGMPAEIALLPMIESDFDPHCISHKGAVGLWQIMPTLGRIHGLKQNAWYDGRKDVYESTKVALDHLQYLHKRFNGNWLHALAAYNVGETRLQKAISQNRSAKKPTDFWSLKLPKETSHFVPKLLALATIIKSPREYGVALPSIPNKPVIAQVNTGKAIDISHAAKLVDVSEIQLRKLNPALHKKTMHPNGPFNLVVPISQAQDIKNKISTTVVPAQKSPAIALSPSQSNKVKNSSLTKSKVQSSARTPLPSDVVLSKSSQHDRQRIHVVKQGESIPTISKKYNVKIANLNHLNKLKPNAILQTGQRIIIIKRSA